MWRLACLPFVIHSVAMLIDETRFHLRRGLPRWERLGHPADTLTVIACYGIALFLSPTPRSFAAYVAAAVFSALFVTKDEWIHARVCTGGELWLHAFLFTLHPVLLALVGLRYYGGSGAAESDRARAFFGSFLVGQAALTFVFMLWQALYWNGPWQPREEAEPARG